MYACQLMVPCVDSALKSTKSSPRLGAVRGQGSELGCAGSQRGACERKTREGLGTREPMSGGAPCWHVLRLVKQLWVDFVHETSL